MHQLAAQPPLLFLRTAAKHRPLPNTQNMQTIKPSSDVTVTAHFIWLDLQQEKKKKKQAAFYKKQFYVLLG